MICISLSSNLLIKCNEIYIYIYIYIYVCLCVCTYILYIYMYVERKTSLKVLQILFFLLVNVKFYFVQFLNIVFIILS